MIKVFLLDDHELVRRGLAQLINAQDDIQVVGDAGTAAAALRSVDRCRPDVAVLDISLDEGSGIEVCSEITAAHPTVACIMLTSVIDDRALIEAHDAGAVAFALKSVDSNELLTTIRKVASGACLLDAVDVRLARRRLDDLGDGVIDSLSPQERLIFEMLGRGYSNREIANEMILAEKTIKNYVSNVLSKLGLTRRAEAAGMAARLDEREAGWRGS